MINELGFRQTFETPFQKLFYLQENPSGSHWIVNFESTNVSVPASPIVRESSLDTLVTYLWKKM